LSMLACWAFIPLAAVYSARITVDLLACSVSPLAFGL